MNEELQDLEQGKKQRRSWLSAASLAVTVLATMFAVYVYFSTREEKVPCYTVESTSLVAKTGEGVEGIRILYRGKDVPELTSTTLRFWNAGSRTIDGTDVAYLDPLRILVPRGAKVLACKVIRCERPTVAPRLTNQGRVVLVKFDFLDRNDGCVVQVLHTGRPSQVCRVMGTIKGSQPIRRVTATRVEDLPGWTNLFFYAACIFAMVITWRLADRGGAAIRRLLRREREGIWTDLMLFVIVYSTLFWGLSALIRYAAQRTACTSMPPLLR